ncbi:hypothetical protein DFH09DRAFT_1070373 [Mycena vulgaris]|nr:hypothetical protein DFH09DRAFT_1070373 [Mycena vulgaris]
MEHIGMTETIERKERMSDAPGRLSPPKSHRRIPTSPLELVGSKDSPAARYEAPEVRPSVEAEGNVTVENHKCGVPQQQPRVKSAVFRKSEDPLCSRTRGAEHEFAGAKHVLLRHQGLVQAHILRSLRLTRQLRTDGAGQRQGSAGHYEDTERRMRQDPDPDEGRAGNGTDAAISRGGRMRELQPTANCVGTVEDVLSRVRPGEDHDSSAILMLAHNRLRALATIAQLWRPVDDLLVIHQIILALAHERRRTGYGVGGADSRSG